MSVSRRARRAALVSLVLGAIAASCALPGYEVGESSPGSTATAASGGGNDGSTSASAGGAGGDGGKGGAGGAGGDGGKGGAGGENNTPVCPPTPPKPDSPCPWPGMIKCFYPTEGMTCFEDEYKCVGDQAPNGTWEFISKATFPPPGCPENCSSVCPVNPPKAGCFCRAGSSAGSECNYNFCLEAQPHGEQFICPPPAEPGRTSVWESKGAAECCDPESMAPCPGCAKHTDVNGKELFLCPP